MNNLQNSKLHVLCPNCRSDIILPFKLLEFYLSLQKIKGIPAISIHRTFTLNEENKIFLQNFCKESVRRKPFVSNIILTKPYRMAITELVKANILDSEDLTGPVF